MFIGLRALRRLLCLESCVAHGASAQAHLLFSCACSPAMMLAAWLLASACLP